MSIDVFIRMKEKPIEEYLNIMLVKIKVYYKY